ncbi:hypothetical protein [Hanstruepera ponticola]|uniref:hypothetical protein n=1 Tax=Hanstruepera ponticola TaxID=2042995 RepID=UPI00177AF518|nr:hypothetical protein [Hanstruepera ponticola]
MRILVILLSVFFLFRCSSDDANNSSDDEVYLEIARNRIIDGDWIATFFLDNSQNRTLEFEEYSFNFHNDKSIEITYDLNNYVGSWNVFVVDEKLKFHMMIDVPDINILYELNENWEVQYILEDRIVIKKSELVDSKILHFSKN